MHFCLKFVIFCTQLNTENKTLIALAVWPQVQRHSYEYMTHAHIKHKKTLQSSKQRNFCIRGFFFFFGFFCFFFFLVFQLFLSSLDISEYFENIVLLDLKMSICSRPTLTYVGILVFIQANCLISGNLIIFQVFSYNWATN